jgi:hypothetical protein
MTSTEIDIFEFSQRGEEVPLAPAYRVRIDGEVFRFDTPKPTGELLLSKAGKRPCAFELIEEFAHGKNDVVEPDEEVDLRKPGLKGFITAHKEIVIIFSFRKGGPPVSNERFSRQHGLCGLTSWVAPTLTLDRRTLQLQPAKQLRVRRHNDR